MENVKRMFRVLSLLCLIGVIFQPNAFCNEVILKTALQRSYPKFYEQNGEFKGLCMDIMIAVERESEGEIKFFHDNQFIPWKRILNYLETGRIDIFFGLVKNEKRIKKYQFLETPIYPVKHVIAVRKYDDVSISGFDDIARLGKQGIVLTNLGAALSSYIKSKNDKIIIEQTGKDIKSNLHKLINRRGRFVYYHDLGLKSVIKRDGFSDMVKVLPVSFRDYKHYVALSNRVAPDMVSKLDSVLKTLEEKGTLKDIYDNYLSFH